MNMKAFLFHNASVKQTIFKNTFWMALADGIAKILRLILLIYVAKILGATEYGKFSFAFAFVYMFAILADLGVGEIIVREFAKEKEKEKEFTFIVSLKILLNLLALALVFLGSFFVTQSLEIQKIIWILAMYLLIDSFFHLFCCFFRARQEMQYESFAKIFQTLILTGAGFFMLFNFPSAMGLSYVYVLSILASLILLLIIFILKNNFLTIKWDINIWKKYLSMSWPLAFVGALMMIYNQIDSIMLGYWGQIAETGWYNAAYRIVGAALVVNGLIATAFFPVFSKYFKEAKESKGAKEMLQKIWNYHMEIMIFLSVSLILIGVIFAHQIINFIYSSNFSPSILAFQILIIMAGIAYLQTPFNHILIAANQQKKLFLATFLGATINVVLNLILIPKFSLYGAALSTVATWTTLLLVCFYFTSRYTPINPFKFRFIILKTIWEKIKTS